MKSIFILIIYSVLSINIFGQLYNEPRLQYGGVFDVSHNIHFADFRSFQLFPDTNSHFTGGNGNGLFIGGFLEFALYPDLSIALREGYYIQNGFMKSYEKTTRPLTLNGSTVEKEIEHTIDVSLQSIGVEALFNYRFWDKFLFSFGGHLHVYSGKTVIQKEEVKSPDNVSYAQGAKIRTLFEGLMTEANFFSSGISAGLGYEFSISDKRSVRLAPEFLITYNFIPVTSDKDWNVLSFRLGVALKLSSVKQLEITAEKKYSDFKIYEYDICNRDKQYFQEPDSLTFRLKRNIEGGLKFWNYEIYLDNDKIDSSRNFQTMPQNFRYAFNPEFLKQIYQRSNELWMTVNVHDKAGQSIGDTFNLDVLPLKLFLKTGFRVNDENNTEINAIRIENLQSCQKDTSYFITPIINIYPYSESFDKLSGWNLKLYHNKRIILDSLGKDALPDKFSLSPLSLFKNINVSGSLDIKLSILDIFANECMSELFTLPVQTDKYLLNSSFRAFGVFNEDTIIRYKENPTIRIEERNSIRIQPLLNYIFFGNNTSELDVKYKTLTKDETESFNIDALHNSEIIETYYNILNIIGKRLSELNEAKLTITGCNNNYGKERNDEELSLNRAKKIYDYLVNIWDIDTSRIIIQIRNAPVSPSFRTQKDDTDKDDALAEDRRVELFSEYFAILEPVLTQGIRYDFSPKKIIYTNKIESNAGIQKIKLFIPDKSKEIVLFDSAIASIDSISWKVENNIKDIFSSVKHFIPINFEVTDNKGNICNNRLDLELRKSSIQERKMFSRDTSFDEYSLILFNFDSYEISGTNKTIVDFIKAKVNPGAVVDINGMTDRVGTDRYNRELSLSRAKNTSSALNFTNQIVTVTGSGESIFKYNNELPEGRFYSRTVNITIKNPLK